MKKVLLIALLFCSSSVLFAQNAPAAFDKVTHSFGKIPQGVAATTVFSFTNTGNKPLVILNVMSTCGCTTPEYARTPVLPGKKATIKAGYDAAALGAFKRSLTVRFAGYDKPVDLVIEGEVVRK